MSESIRKDNTLSKDDLTYMKSNGQVYSRLELIMDTDAAKQQVEYEKETALLDKAFQEIKRSIYR